MTHVILIVLLENQGSQVAFFIEDRQAVFLVAVKQLVCFPQGNTLMPMDDLFDRGHVLCDLVLQVILELPEILIRDQPNESATPRTVFRDRHRRMARLFHEFDHLAQRHIRRGIGIAGYKARLVHFHLTNYLRL